MEEGKPEASERASEQLAQSGDLCDEQLSSLPPALSSIPCAPAESDAYKPTAFPTPGTLLSRTFMVWSKSFAWTLTPTSGE